MLVRESMICLLIVFSVNVCLFFVMIRFVII